MLKSGIYIEALPSIWSIIMIIDQSILSYYYELSSTRVYQQLDVNFV